ncbi:MAG TPA: thioesterase, partial [Alphaproteobacteria bacterium]|nr:thioesterase [Alphaproteobacteria bacterium]
DGEVSTIGLVKGCFYNQKNKKTVPTSDLLAYIGYEGMSPDMPPHVKDWQTAEKTLKEVTKNG